MSTSQHEHSPASSADSRILDIDSAPSSTSTISPNIFPQPAGITVSNVRINKEPWTSPALSGFTFDLPELPSAASSVPDTSDITFSDPFTLCFSKPLPHAVSQPPTRPIRSPTAMTTDSNDIARSESSSRRVDYLNRAFSNGSGEKEDAKERVQRESPIIAELRTNVIIKDEYTTITSLSQHLSERYRRHESAIVLTVTHSTCLMMAGSFEPAYILDITAIPSEVQPTTNKRNAYLIQCLVAEVLHVPSSRGVVRFSGVPEQNLATNGTTVLGDIERAEKEAAMEAAKQDSSPGLIRSLTNKSSQRFSVMADKRKSLGVMVDKRKSVGAPVDNRKSLVRSSSGERRSIFNGESNVMQTIERKFSTRSLRSVKSLKESISPPIPTEFPAELLPSPTSIQFSLTSSPKTANYPDLPSIYRLSPLHHLGRSPSTATNGKEIPQPPPSPSPLSQNPPSSTAPQLPPLTPSPSPPELKRGTEKEPMVTSAARRPMSSSGESRPQSARKNLSNITGPAGAIPSPPPVPLETPEVTALRHKLSKRKSFVNLFHRKGGDGVRS